MTATITKRGKSYRIKVYCGRIDGKSIYKYATFVPDPSKSDKRNEKLLRDFATEFEYKCKGGNVESDVTFGEYAKKWMASYGSGELEKTTIATYEDTLRLAILPRIGRMKLKNIRPMTIQQFVNSLRSTKYSYNGGKRQGTYSEEYIRNARAIVSSILSSAVENGLIGSNPCLVRSKSKSRNRKALERQEIHFFTPEQAAIFLDIIKRPIPIVAKRSCQVRNGKTVVIEEHVNGTMNISFMFQVLYTLAIYSGCRRGELLALTWKDIDFKASCISIDQSIAYVASEGVFRKDPKSTAGFRKITMPPEVMDLLAEYKEQMRSRMQSMGTAWKGNRTFDESFLFTQENGKVMNPSTPRRKMQRIIDCYNKSRKPEKPELPNIRFHDLRHTSASILVASGLDLKSIASRIGHSDPSVTLKVYAHAFQSRDSTAAMALSKSLQEAAKDVREETNNVLCQENRKHSGET